MSSESKRPILCHLPDSPHPKTPSVFLLIYQLSSDVVDPLSGNFGESPNWPLHKLERGRERNICH